MSLRWIKSWLPGRRRRRPPLDDYDRTLDDSGLREAVRKHAVSSRLVRLRASRSASALRRLNAILALRVKALEGIAAAEDALAVLDKKERDDK